MTMTMTATLLALYFAVLLAALLLKGRVVRGPWLFLLRAFFPNWKFFDVVGHVPHLLARSAQADAAGEPVWSEWLLIYPRRTRHWLHLFHNPDTNLGLGRQNVVDHFWSDLYDLPDGADPRGLVTYAMMERLAQDELLAHYGSFSHWQFELRMVLDGPECVYDTYTMMQSPVNAC
jgi:hypothetical protein